MARATASGPNWTIIAGVAIAAATLGALAMVFPRLACALGGQAEASVVVGFGTLWTSCGESDPIMGAPIGLTAFTFLAGFIGVGTAVIAMFKLRQVDLDEDRSRRAQRSQLRRHKTSSEQVAAPYDRTPAVDELPSTNPIPAANSGVNVIADASDDPLAGLDAWTESAANQKTTVPTPAIPAIPSAPRAVMPEPIAPPPRREVPTPAAAAPGPIPASAVTETVQADIGAPPPTPGAPGLAPKDDLGAIPRFVTRPTTGDEALLPDIDDLFEQGMGISDGAPATPAAAVTETAVAAPLAPSAPASVPGPSRIPAPQPPDLAEAETFPALEDPSTHSPPVADVSWTRDDTEAQSDEKNIFSAPGIPVTGEDTLPASPLPRAISDSFASFGLDTAAPILPSKPVVGDGLYITFRTQRGTPIAARTVWVTSPDGTGFRAWIGNGEPGVLALPNLTPGTYTLAFEDGAFLRESSKTWRRSVTLDVALNTVTRAEFVTPDPKVIYASSYATGDNATGQRNAPFPSIKAALVHALDRRKVGDAAFDAVEIRIDPTARLPSGRHGLANGPNAKQWLRWWNGEPFDSSVSWTRPAKHSALRNEARDTSALAEELLLDGVEDLRITNSAYAGLRERVALSPGFEIDLERELAAIPLAQLGPPNVGPRAAFRIEIKDCTRVFIEGVHILGCEGQSGVAIRNANAVTLRRCWVDLFASGPTQRSGKFGVGRGLQIDESGGEARDACILLDTCDVGWNTAARRAVPIRGAGVAVYDANVEINRCHVHDNVGTQAPTGFFAAGASKVIGSENHRSNNDIIQA